MDMQNILTLLEQERQRAAENEVRSNAKSYWHGYLDGLSVAIEQMSVAPDARQAVADHAPAQRQRPVCQVHGRPMWHQQGKHGWFWSCHQRNADGSYCSYRPAQAAA